MVAASRCRRSWESWRCLAVMSASKRRTLLHKNGEAAMVSTDGMKASLATSAPLGLRTISAILMESKSSRASSPNSNETLRRANAMGRSADSPVRSPTGRVAARKRARRTSAANVLPSAATLGTPSRSLGTTRSTSSTGWDGAKCVPIGRAAGASGSPAAKSRQRPSGKMPTKRLTRNSPAASAPASSSRDRIPQVCGPSAASRRSSSRSWYRSACCRCCGETSIPSDQTTLCGTVMAHSHP